MNFKNTIVIMTSNLGAEVIMERMKEVNDTNREQVYAGTRAALLELIETSLRPEFLNRVDEVLVFRPLSEEHLEQILAIQFEQLVQKPARRQGLDVALTEQARAWLAKRGYDPVFGARPLKRLLQKEVVNPLATEIVRGEAREGARIMIDVRGAGLEFETWGGGPLDGEEATSPSNNAA